MAKNYMADVAKLLGVELEEEFNLKDCSGETQSTNRFKITMDGLYEFWDNTWMHHDWIGDLLLGKYEIVKLPWKPKFGGIYYHPTICDPYICDERWYGTTFDCAMCALGMCYRTCEEAKANFKEDYKKLAGKEFKE